MLWQHLFWFFGHPEVYILVLPAPSAVFSEILPVFARKPIFGYKAIAAARPPVSRSSSMLVWAHHMFATRPSTVVLAFFMLSSFADAVPTGVKIFNWVATLWRAHRSSGACPCSTSRGLPRHIPDGGISGVILAIFPVDWQLHDSYFVVAHFHYVLFGGAVFGIFAGLVLLVPEDVRPADARGLGKVSFWLMFIGFNLTFLIQHSAGLSGMPRRIYDYPSDAGWNAYNMISAIGSFILGIGVVVTISTC